MRNLLMRFFLLNLMVVSVSACGDSSPAKAGTAHCTQAFIDAYTDTKASLALWSTGGTKASDEDTEKSCKALTSAKTESCQIDCNKVSSESLCPSKGGTMLASKDLLDECKSFQRRAKGKQ